MPPGQGSGFNGQQPYPHPQAQPIHDGRYDQYNNMQYQQYQNAMFVPAAFPQQQQQQQAHQQQAPHPQQQMPRHQHQPLQTQGLNYHNQALQHGNTIQFQHYEPPFDQRQRQFQPAPQNNAPAQMIPSPQQFMQPLPQQHQHQQQQLHQQQQQQQHIQHHQNSPRQYSQQTSWQHMPPPVSTPTSVASYQQQPLPPSPSPQVIQQHHQQPSSHTSSPITNQSPQIPHQHLPNGRITNASVSMGSTPNARIQKAHRVSASPQLTPQGLARSPSVSSGRSPAPGLIPHHKDTTSLLICVAEELLQKARNDAAAVASSGDAKQLQEYQKLVATGLGCLEVVLGSNKLPPRLEARLQLRYVNILSEETTNVMEAETTLTKGITLCERVRLY